MGKRLALLFSVLAVAAQGQLYTPVDVGTVANDKTGDPLRKAFQKINANWANLYGTTLSSNAIWHLAQLSAGTNPVGVNAFQGRKGNVVLQAGDVTGALGYTPAGTNLVGPSSAGLMAGLPGDASLVYNGIGEWVPQSSGTDGTGSPGTAATIGIGSVSTLAPGAAATVQNTGKAVRGAHSQIARERVRQLTIVGVWICALQPPKPFHLGLRLDWTILTWHKLSCRTFMERMLIRYRRPIQKSKGLTPRRPSCRIAVNRGESRLFAPK